MKTCCWSIDVGRTGTYVVNIIFVVLFTYLLLLTWDTWGGVSRSPCRRLVDTYWRLCGQPFFLPVSFFAFTLGLSTCDVFLFLISVVWKVILAVAWAVSCSLHPDVLQHCLKGLLTIRRYCSFWETIPVLHCLYCKWVLSDVCPSEWCY